MDAKESRRVGYAARDRTRLKRMEKLMISYMIDPHVEENYWTDYMPEHMRDTVVYWANRKGWGKPPSDLIDEWLDHGFYRRYAPLWLRLCSAISRRQEFAEEFSNTKPSPNEDLAKKIYDQAVQCPEAPVLFKKVVHRGLWLGELKKILDLDRSLITKFAPVDGLAANMHYLLAQKPVRPKFNYETSFEDCARHCMALHGLTSRFQEVENDLQTFLQIDERAHFWSLPLWLRNFLHKNRHGTNEQALENLRSGRDGAISIVTADPAAALSALQNLFRIRPGILRFIEDMD